MKKNNTIFIIGMLLLCIISGVITYFSLAAAGIIEKDKIDLVYNVKAKNSDGIEYSNDFVNINDFDYTFEGSLLEGHSSNLTVKNEAKELGSHIIDFKASIYNQKGIEVTDMYDVTINSLEIEIVKRSVDIVIYKEREGRLEPGDYGVSSENKLLDGHFLGYDKRNNKYYVIDYFNVDVTKYYDLNFDFQIDNALEIELSNIQKVYDGIPAKLDYTISSGSLMNDDHKIVVDYYIDGSLVDEKTGLSKVTNKSYTAKVKVLDKTNNDVTSKYNVNIIDGNINITKRKVNILIDSLEKVYDANKVQIRDLTIHEENLLDGHKALVKLNNSDTDLINVSSKPVLINYDVQINDFSGNDLTENYEIIKSGESYINILPREASVEIEDYVKTYDSKKIDLKEFKVLSNNLILGHRVEVELIINDQKLLIDAGNNIIKYSIKVLNKNGDNVTRNYNISSNKQFKLVINQRFLDIIIPNFKKEYDGETLVVNNDLIKYSNLALNDKVEINIKGEFNQSDVTKVPVAIDQNNLNINVSRNGEPVSDNYIFNVTAGSYTITKRNVSLNILNNKFEYSNKDLVLNNSDFEISNLLINHHIEDITLPYLEVGTYNLEKSKIQILDGTNRNVTKNYEIYLGNNSIEITKINLDFSLNSIATKPSSYTGEILNLIKPENVIITLKNQVVDSTQKQYILDNVLIKYEYLKNGYAVDNIIEVGHYQVSILGIESISSDIKNNYSFTFNKNSVEFTVEKLNLIVQANDITKDYDNKPIEKDDFILTSTNLPTGFRMEVINKLNKFDVTETPYNFSNDIKIEVFDRTNKNVTQNFVIKVNNAHLTINKRNIYIEFDNVSKVYDGTVLNTTLKVLNVINLCAGDYVLGTVLTDNAAAGNYSNVETNVKVMNSSGVDVSKNYENISNNFEVQILRRHLEVKAPNITKVYDGNTEFKIEGSITTNLVSSHKVYLNYNVSDKVNVQNTILRPTVTISDQTLDVTSNYDITIVEGSLIITPKKVNVTFNTTVKKDLTYNNKNQFLDNNILILDDQNINTRNLVVEFEYRKDGFVVSEVKDAGLYKVTVKNISYNNNNYDFIYNGIYDLEIKPKALNVTLKPNYNMVYEGREINPGDYITLDKDVALGNDNIKLVLVRNDKLIEKIRNVGTYSLKVVDFEMISGIKSNYSLDLKTERTTSFEITKKILNFESTYQTVEYNGEYNQIPFPKLVTELPGNDKLKIMDNSEKNVGTYAIDCFELISYIFDEDGKRAESNYTTDTYDAKGTLVITKREVTIYTESATIDSNSLNTKFENLVIENALETDFANIKNHLTFVDFSKYSNGIYQNAVVYNHDNLSKLYPNYKISFVFGTILINK